MSETTQGAGVVWRELQRRAQETQDAMAAFNADCAPENEWLVAETLEAFRLVSTPDVILALCAALEAGEADSERLTRLMALIYEGEATRVALSKMDAATLTAFLDRLSAVSRGEYRERTCMKCGAGMREADHGAYKGLLYCEDFCDQFGPRDLAAPLTETTNNDQR